MYHIILCIRRTTRSPNDAILRTIPVVKRRHDSNHQDVRCHGPPMAHFYVAPKSVRCLRVPISYACGGYRVTSLLGRGDDEAGCHRPSSCPSPSTYLFLPFPHSVPCFFFLFPDFRFNVYWFHLLFYQLRTRPVYGQQTAVNP